MHLRKWSPDVFITSLFSTSLMNLLLVYDNTQVNRLYNPAIYICHLCTVYVYNDINEGF